MAGPPHHVPLSASGTPGQDESTRDLYLPYGYAAHQYPPSLAAEPSTFSENHLLYNTLMQHSSAPVHLSYSMPLLGSWHLQSCQSQYGTPSLERE
jgi:hypothetical protein